MRELFYVSVVMLSSTTKLGKSLQKVVISRYDRALMTKEQAQAIPTQLADEICRLCAENKRFTNMEVRAHGFQPGLKLVRGSVASVWAVTPAGAKAFTDNRPFTIHIDPVLKDLAEKGMSVVDY